VKRPSTDRQSSSPHGSDASPAAPKWILGLVVLVAFGCYTNSLHGALLFGDFNAIVNNRLVRDLDVVGIFSTPSWWGESGVPTCRPFTTLGFALNSAAHGLSPFGYHLVNVGLHAAVCLLLVVVLVRTTGNWQVSALAGLLFAAHPVHTEAVASVVGRAETLAAALGLGAWWLFIRGRKSTRCGTAWRCAAGVTMSAAVLAEENAATLVAVIVAADVIYRGATEGIRSVLHREASRYSVLAAFALGALALRMLITGGIAAEPDRLDNVLAGAQSDVRCLTAIKVLALYALKLVWPFHLSADYSYRQIDLVTSPADVGLVADGRPSPGRYWSPPSPPAP
jgi:hypothetical protein